MTSYVGSSFKRMVQENVIHLTVVERAEALEAVSTEQKQLLTTRHQRAQLDCFGIILRTRSYAEHRFLYMYHHLNLQAHAFGGLSYVV